MFLFNSYFYSTRNSCIVNIIMTHFTNRILIFCIFIYILFAQEDIDFFQDQDQSAINESLPTKMTNRTAQNSSSLLIKALSNRNISTNNTHRAKGKKNASSLLTSSTTTTTAPSPYALVSYLVDQFNHYRNIDILSRIKHCNPNLKLNEICETYSFDNHTYSLIREFAVEFGTLRNVYDSLVDPSLVEKLKNLCSTGQWCLTDVTQDDIIYTRNVIQKKGPSFCSLDKCTSRLNTQIVSCPSLTPQVC